MELGGLGESYHKVGLVKTEQDRVEGRGGPRLVSRPSPSGRLLPPACRHVTTSPSVPAQQPSGCTICEEHYVNGLYANPSSLPALAGLLNPN